MNILILTSLYPYDKYPRKDTPYTVPYFAREWVKQGHNVVAIVNSTSFPLPYYHLTKFVKPWLVKKYNITGSDLTDTSWRNFFDFDDMGVKVYNLPLIKFFPSAQYTNNILNSQLQKIKKLLVGIGFHPDVITGHWINPQLFLISNLKKLYSCKTAFVFEGDFWPEFIDKYNLTVRTTGIDRVGCRSRYASEQLQISLALKEKPFICYSGIPAESIISPQSCEKTFSKQHLSVLSAGRLVKLKHFDAVILACAKSFELKNYSLDIAGEGALYEELNEIIVKNDYGQSVHLLGKISRDDLLKKMKVSDVFVLISDHEAFGIVYLEAMSQGCLVVASKNGGIDGVIIDGENGFLCEEGNADELSDVLLRISRLPLDEKKRISLNAVSTAQKYTNDKVAKYYLEDIISD